MTAEERAIAIADKIVPAYRAVGSRYSCTGTVAKMWNAAYEGAHSAHVSQAAQPAEADGWVMVPSKIVAGLPRLPVGPSLSEEYWFGWTNAMQAARNHIDKHAAYLAATPKALTSTAGDESSITDADIYAALRHGFGDKTAAEVMPEFATPPAPNDDLRAALEELVERASHIPTKTPAPGSSVTEHPFIIEAGIIWSLARAVRRARAALKENRRG